jgi:hypothetical protein
MKMARLLLRAKFRIANMQAHSCSVSHAQEMESTCMCFIEMAGRIKTDRGEQGNVDK